MINLEQIQALLAGFRDPESVHYYNSASYKQLEDHAADLIEAVRRMEPFLDECAGIGIQIDGVDAADLYIKLFPEKYRAALSAQDKEGE